MNLRKLLCAILATSIATQSAVFCNDDESTSKLAKLYAKIVNTLKDSAAKIMSPIKSIKNGAAGITKKTGIKGSGEATAIGSLALLIGGSSMLAYKKFFAKVKKIQPLPLSFWQKVRKLALSKHGLVIAGGVAATGLLVLLWKLLKNRGNTPDENNAPDLQELANDLKNESAKRNEEAYNRVKKVENERLKEEKARLEEEAKLEKRRKEAKQIEEKAKREEEARRAKLEEEAKRREEEAKRAEEARLAEEVRLAEEARRAEEARLAEEARRAEEARLTEEARRAEEARLTEEARKAKLEEEAKRREEEARLEEEEARRAEEARLKEEEEEENKKNSSGVAIVIPNNVTNNTPIEAPQKKVATKFENLKNFFVTTGATIMKKIGLGKQKDPKEVKRKKAQEERSRIAQVKKEEKKTAHEAMLKNHKETKQARIAHHNEMIKKANKRKRADKKTKNFVNEEMKKISEQNQQKRQDLANKETLRKQKNKREANRRKRENRRIRKNLNELTERLNKELRTANGIIKQEKKDTPREELENTIFAESKQFRKTLNSKENKQVPEVANIKEKMFLKAKKMVTSGFASGYNGIKNSLGWFKNGTSNLFSNLFRKKEAPKKRKKKKAAIKTREEANDTIRKNKQYI